MDEIKVKEKSKGGRTRKDTEAVKERICIGISNGELLTDLCKEVGIDRTSIYRWFKEDKEFYNRYAISREMRGDLFHEEIEGYKKNIVGKELDYQTARVLIDTCKWQAAKFYPKMYGDKQHIEHSGNITNPLYDKISKWDDKAILECIDKINEIEESDES